MNRDLSAISPPQIAALASVVAAADNSPDISHSLDLIVSRLREVTRADAVAVELEQDGSLICCYASGHARRWLGRSTPAEESVGGVCIGAGGAIMSGDLGRDRRFSDVGSVEPEIRSLISVPIQLGGSTVGVVHILSGTQNFFSGNDLVVARLVTGSIRRMLAHAVRAEHHVEALDVTDALWSLRERRRSQQRRAVGEGYEVSMVILNITGYLTSEILGHVSMLVRETDQCLRQDAGTYSIVMPGTTAEEAEIAAKRLQRELMAFAAAADDHIAVSCEVRTLIGIDVARSA